MEEGGGIEEKYFTSGELLSALIYFSSLSPVTFRTPSDERNIRFFERNILPSSERQIQLN